MDRMHREREGLSFDGHSRTFTRTKQHHFRLNDGTILNHTRMGGGSKPFIRQNKNPLVGGFCVRILSKLGANLSVRAISYTYMQPSVDGYSV
jgi:hypothetical protein